jgi:zinc protease
MMTTAGRTETSLEPDESLWQRVCQGSDAAFEALVRRYQSLVCSVAYSACGNVSQSEDVAQETFWTAWRQRASLERPERLKAWLCGIARNLGNHSRRKELRPAEAAARLGEGSEPAEREPGPAESAISREEETLLWQALELIPEAYREPLILFYREDQSVAEVARALVLSEDAVKQRLSRGRGMLREQVAALVEDGLRRSRPGRRFTVAVMGGLASHAAGAKSALAGAGAGVTAGAGAWKAAGVGGAVSALASLVGALGGLYGGWIGTWIPAQAAPTRRERHAILSAGRRMLIVSVLFLAGLEGLIYAFAGTPSYLIGWCGWMLTFWAYIALECFQLARSVERIRAERDPNDPPNETPLRAGWAAAGNRIGDRVYRSEAALLGIPLIDVNLSAPLPPSGGKPDDSSGPDSGRRVARGWIAIGDDARGILLAIGSTARGLFALGGRAVGVVSLGGLAIGVIALGGLGLGVLGIGGLGAGVYALGGGAVGWRSAGGLALGWDMACGGGAIAQRAALGGLAIAGEYALGGEARARHANDESARSALLDHPFARFAFTAMGQKQVLSRLATRGEAQVPTSRSLAGNHFKLDNGLSVTIRPIEGAHDLALLVLYRIGGDHDPNGLSGLAHLVEHVYVTAAAGAAPARSAGAFFQQYPAGCNAQTGDRYTVIATVFPPGDLDHELTDAVARMGDLRITAADLDREKPRLLEEVANMFGRIPSLSAVNIARELIRPTPRGGRKGGLPEHVQAITLDQVQSHWKRYYKPRNAILVLAGAVDVAAARQAIMVKFATLAAGEAAPAPGEPGAPRPGSVRELAVRSLLPQAEPMVCLAYAAPELGSELHAPFLVLVARLWAKSQPAARGESGRPSVYFPLLEDPAVLGVSAAVKPGESTSQAIARLESIVAEALAPGLRDKERVTARQTFAFFLGTADLPDFVLAQNPYGVALSLARREQMGVDSAKLGRAVDTLAEDRLRRAASEIFAPSRHAGAFVSIDKRK